MPSRGPLLHFSDILDAVFWIEQYTNGYTFADYESDIKTQDAVERRLQIVTEAVIRLGESCMDYSAEVDWSNWRGLGNLLRHGCHKVDSEIIWTKLHNELPLLKQVAVEAVARLR